MVTVVKKLSVKAVVSTLLIVLFLFLAFSGALLYFGKTGMVWGVSRAVLREVHFYVACALCILVPVHLVLNFKLYLQELRSVGKRKDE